jgi:hypothetical protein
MLTLVGFVMNWLYSAVMHVYHTIRKKLTCSITLQSRDSLFKIVREYLTKSGYLQGCMTDLKVQQIKKNYNWWDFDEVNESERNKVKIEYLPGPGNHIFVYNGKKMWVAINEE